LIVINILIIVKVREGAIFDPIRTTPGAFDLMFQPSGAATAVGAASTGRITR